MVSSKMPNLMSQSSDESFLTHGGQQRIPEDQDIPPENGRNVNADATDALNSGEI